MNTIYIERSASNGRNGNWIEELALEPAPERIVVGTGPGSFAGIRAAIAFAQGYALGRKCEVLGLPSPCAIAAETYSGTSDLQPLSVVGDARRGMAWVALFNGYEMTHEVFQVAQAELKDALPAGCRVVTPDAVRIEGLLRETFGARYLGGCLPTAAGLKAFAEANPSILKPEPLPIYLNPAVRD